MPLKALWNQSITGKGVKIAVFDTGISEQFEKDNSKNIIDKTNWTNEKFGTLDLSGHGTAVTSIIQNKNPLCTGIAKDSHLYILKVFNKEKETHTSWILNAFDYIFEKQIDIINFSIGGLDFTD